MLVWLPIPGKLGALTWVSGVQEGWQLSTGLAPAWQVGFGPRQGQAAAFLSRRFALEPCFGHLPLPSPCLHLEVRHRNPDSIILKPE